MCWCGSKVVHVHAWYGVKQIWHQHQVPWCGYWCYVRDTLYAEIFMWIEWKVTSRDIAVMCRSLGMWATWTRCDVTWCHMKVMWHCMDVPWERYAGCRRVMVWYEVVWRNTDAICSDVGVIWVWCVWCRRDMCMWFRCEMISKWCEVICLWYGCDVRPARDIFDSKVMNLKKQCDYICVKCDTNVIWCESGMIWVWHLSDVSDINVLWCNLFILCKWNCAVCCDRRSRQNTAKTAWR